MGITISRLQLPVQNKTLTIENSRSSVTLFRNTMVDLSEKDKGIEIDDSGHVSGIIITPYYHFWYSFIYDNNIGKMPNKIKYLLVSMRNTNKINLIDNKDNKYNLGDIVNKMQMLGQDLLIGEAYFNNVQIQLNKQDCVVVSYDNGWG